MADNTLYQMQKSKSPIKRAFAETIVKAAELTGAKERTAKHNREMEDMEKDMMGKFLNAAPTKKTFEELGIQPRAFAITVMRVFPFNNGKYPIFLKGFIALRDELRTARPATLDPAKYEDIIGRLIRYTEGEHIVKQTDFLVQDGGAGEVDEESDTEEDLDDATPIVSERSYIHPDIRNFISQFPTQPEERARNRRQERQVRAEERARNRQRDRQVRITDDDDSDDSEMEEAMLLVAEEYDGPLETEEDYDAFDAWLTTQRRLLLQRNNSQRQPQNTPAGSQPVSTIHTPIDTPTLDIPQFEEDVDEPPLFTVNKRLQLTKKTDNDESCKAVQDKWIKDNCAVCKSMVTLDDFTPQDKDIISVRVYDHTTGTFGIGHCIKKEDIRSMLASDLNNPEPKYIYAIYKRRPDTRLSSRETVAGHGTLPSQNLVIQLNVGTIVLYVTLGSIRTAMDSKIKTLFAVPLYGGKRRRIGNLHGRMTVVGANHGQVPGFVVYKLYTKSELSNIQGRELPTNEINFRMETCICRNVKQWLGGQVDINITDITNTIIMTLIKHLP